MYEKSDDFLVFLGISSECQSVNGYASTSALPTFKASTSVTTPSSFTAREGNARLVTTRLGEAMLG